MTTDEINLWLTDGIAAAKAGKRAEARDLLLRVVNADENNVRAWLWLSGVVTTLEDREVCLQNVLALDPVNEAAQRGLAKVRAEIEATPEIEPESALPRVEVEIAPETKVAFDFSDAELADPLLCVYCAHPTREEDRQCPNCKRDLDIRFYEREQPRWIWTGWMVSMAEAIFAIGGLLVLLAILASALSAVKFNGQSADISQLLLLYLSQSNAVPAQAQTSVLMILPREQFFLRLVYIVLVVIVGFGLLTRQRLFYILYVGTLAIEAALLYLSTTIDRVFVAGGAARTPLEGILQVALNEALGMFVLLSGILFGGFLLIKIVMAFAMNGDFDTRTERLWCMIDKTVRDPNGAFIRAKTYMKREMWTLAALYLERAVSLQPSSVEYYLALAESYAHLGRYQQSLALLDDAGQLQPDSSIIPNLRGVILEMQKRAPAQPAGGV
ncbi:MAG TPA: tetratricopeptide repeat protein [Anaerolineae bacterium]|nr:tetratricopeptide repeat protein [Anaerolineae bacterium]